MNILKKILPFLLIIIASYFAIRPFLNSGFFPIHDDTQVARVYEMSKSINHGMFPVRWVSDLGYGLGYPIFNFYAPLSYYVGSVINLLGADPLLATKLMMGLGIILSGIFMYLLASEIFGISSGIVAALFYLYAPYHALDIFVRGDIAEFWAYAFIPLVFYGLLKLFKKNSWQNLVIASLGYAVVILSHNLTAFMITPFILLFVLWLIVKLYRNKETKKIYFLAASVLFGIIISCFYWLPALLEMNNTNVLSQIGGGSNFLDHFVCLSQLWSSPWGFGGSVPGCIDGLSFMVGKVHVLVFILSITGMLLLFKKQREINEKIFITLFSIVGFIVSVFLTLEVSKFIWQSISVMSFFQFPWRFLLTASFFSSLLSASAVWLIGFLPLKRIFPHFKIEIAAILILSVLILNIKFFNPQKIVNVTSNYYINEYSLKWTTSKISDEYLPRNTVKPKTATEALLNRQIFSFSETPIEKTADLISLAGILVLLAGIIYRKVKNE